MAELLRSQISRDGGQTKEENENFTVLQKPCMRSFHAVVLRRTAEKCTKYNTRAWRLSLLNRLKCSMDSAMVRTLDSRSH